MPLTGALVRMRPVPDQFLDPKAKTLWMLVGAARTALFASAVCVVVRLADCATMFSLLVSAALVGLFGLWEIGISPQLGLRRWRYGLRSRELEIARGILSARRTVIPLARVEGVVAAQDWLSSWLGLHRLVISTAAGKHEIPALAPAVAQSLEKQLAELATEARETF